MNAGISIAVPTLLTLLAFFGQAPAFAQGKDIRVAFIFDKTGPLEAYVKQTQTGLQMGLEYATNGTMTIGGRKLVLIERDSQGKQMSPSSNWPPPTPMTGPISPSARPVPVPHWRWCRWPKSTKKSC